ncbi:MAG: aminotransferase class V-fold PLP-dependent enzyme [Candidatus Nanohaloarchaea archaeon]
MDAEKLRQDFPALEREVKGRSLTYLDNAATTHKPERVIEAVESFYREHNSNVHRCVHELGEEATEIYDASHEKVADFIGASWDEIVFTKNATESLNLVASSYAEQELSPEDEILVTEMEHHSNLLPWRRAAERTGADLRYVEVAEDGTLDMEDFHSKLSEDTGMVAVSHASNVLGTVNPVREMSDAAHQHGAKIAVDAAQSVPHMPVDVEKLDVDFLAFSSHKMLGPTGIGVLYGKKQLLADTEPFLLGGGMISRVSKEDEEWDSLPWKFEAGTPNIAGAAGTAAAVDYLEEIGMEEVEEHSRELGRKAYRRLESLDGVTAYGPEERVGLASFTVEGAHPHDISSLLNEKGIAVRGGHHCAQPLADVLGIKSTARASFHVYNTSEEVERLVDAVEEAVEVFS